MAFLEVYHLDYIDARMPFRLRHLERMVTNIISSDGGLISFSTTHGDSLTGSLYRKCALAPYE